MERLDCGEVDTSQAIVQLDGRGHRHAALAWALLQLDDQAVGNEVASSMIEKGSWQGELSCWRRDGERIDVQVLTAMICDDQVIQRNGEI